MTYVSDQVLSSESNPDSFLPTVLKRSGEPTEFDRQKIISALSRAFKGTNRVPSISVEELADRVVRIVVASNPEAKGVSVERIQNIVEMVLQAAGEYATARAYILYREDHARKREERPVPEMVKMAFEESSDYFPTQLQQFQFFDKYSRFDYSQGRRETWIETVDRTVDFLHELAGDRLESEVYQRIRLGILEMKVTPSMRLLAMAGPAARRQNLGLYNCSYLPVESIDAFVEALIISMAGCGVGFSVERDYIEQFPRIKRQSIAKPFSYVVDDSAEGWANALRLGLGTWFEGGDVLFDLSQLRPAGAVLKIKGGRASGPEPFRYMLERVKQVILNRQGTYLRSIDAHDIMCLVGNAAVSGGVRRTAMISLFDWEDNEMRHAKDPGFDTENSQRWNANNSVVWPEAGITQLELIQQMTTMVASGNGEPGIFNRQAALSMKPERRLPDRFGTNPCVTGDTWVLTHVGAKQVKEIVGLQHKTFVNGFLHETTEEGFWGTGVKPVIQLETEEGFKLKLTENHKVKVQTGKTRKTQTTEWKEVGQLQTGDKVMLHNQRGAEWNYYGTFGEGWVLGQLVGNGTFGSGRAFLDFWGETAEELAGVASGILGDTHVYRGTEGKLRVQSNNLTQLAEEAHITQGHKGITPSIEKASSEFYCGFLRGLFDADGTVLVNPTKGSSVRLSQSNLDTLEATQRMLARLGIISTIYLNRDPEGYRSLPDGKGGHADYYCKANHELVISNDNIIEFSGRVGFSKPDKAAKLQSIVAGYKRKPNREFFTVTVKELVPAGMETVYDCSVPGVNAFDANGFMSHNCGEILLRPWQLCNLSAVVARAEDTRETLLEKVELATIIGTIQSMATHFPGLRPQWAENCKAERLLGVDITGQLDSKEAQNVQTKKELRDYAVETNKVYADILGINQSASVTCVKPSGNTSQLVNCASGLHARWADYYIRNVRVSATSPIFKVMQDAGVPLNPENGQKAETANTWVASFPVKSPDGAITRNGRTAIQQCNFWLENKLFYTEHNPSVTITYKPEEVLDIIAWVWQHRDEIGGMAFLPSYDAQYAQLPYIEVSKEEYEKKKAEFPTIEWSKLYRYEQSDLTEAAQTLACTVASQEC